MFQIWQFQTLPLTMTQKNAFQQEHDARTLRSLTNGCRTRSRTRSDGGGRSSRGEEEAGMGGEEERTGPTRRGQEGRGGNHGSDGGGTESHSFCEEGGKAVRRCRRRRMRIWTRWHRWRATSAFSLISFIAFSLTISIDEGQQEVGHDQCGFARGRN